jgi:hypothetical protein
MTDPRSRTRSFLGWLTSQYPVQHLLAFSFLSSADKPVLDTRFKDEVEQMLVELLGPEGKKTPISEYTDSLVQMLKDMLKEDRGRQAQHRENRIWNQAITEVARRISGKDEPWG